MDGDVRDMHVLELIGVSDSSYHGIEGGYKLFIVGWKDPGYVRINLFGVSSLINITFFSPIYSILDVLSRRVNGVKKGSEKMVFRYQALTLNSMLWTLWVLWYLDVCSYCLDGCHCCWCHVHSSLQLLPRSESIIILGWSSTSIEFVYMNWNLLLLSWEEVHPAWSTRPTLLGWQEIEFWMFWLAQVEAGHIRGILNRLLRCCVKAFLVTSDGAFAGQSGWRSSHPRI